MAQNEKGELIDPLNGQKDIENKIFRHVSPAFAEDPVRILRIARFSSALTEFSIDPGTQQLMQSMVTNGEVDALVAERVWKELERAIENAEPW